MLTAARGRLQEGLYRGWGVRFKGVGECILSGLILGQKEKAMPEAVNIPAKEEFPKVMRRTLELTGGKVSVESVGKLYKIFKTLRWDFPDYQLSAYTVLDSDGKFGYAESIQGSADAHITMDAERLHTVVYGRGNMAKMFLSGQIKLKGVPMYKLMRFVPLLNPFLESYREACEETGA